MKAPVYCSVPCFVYQKPDSAANYNLNIFQDKKLVKSINILVIGLAISCGVLSDAIFTVYLEEKDAESSWATDLSIPASAPLLTLMLFCLATDGLSDLYGAWT